MANFYKTSDGDILPFHQIIRVMQKTLSVSRVSNGVRIMFVNGCVDIEKEEMEEFLTTYEEWLEKTTS